MQDDQLQPLLTVSEAMSIAAKLKLANFQQSDRDTRVRKGFSTFIITYFLIKKNCLLG